MSAVPTVAKGLRLTVAHALALETLTAEVVERGRAALPGAVLEHLTPDRLVSESEVAGACVAAILHLVNDAPHRSLDERARSAGILAEYIAAWDVPGPPSERQPPEVAQVLRAVLAKIEGAR